MRNKYAYYKFLKYSGMLFLWGVFFIGISFKSSAQDTTTLIMIGKVPMIKGSINGKLAYFIVDTGASFTVLNEGESKYYGFSVHDNAYYQACQMVGIGGISDLKEARKAHIKLGEQEIAFINKSMPMHGIQGHFRGHRIRVAGIIGTDLLSIMGCQIDYKNRKLVFPAKG